MSTLFSIECETCRARLKVTDRKAIGQILACPKCGSMVQVQAPPDWQAPSDSRASSDEDDESETSKSHSSDLPFVDVNSAQTANSKAGHNDAGHNDAANRRADGQSVDTDESVFDDIDGLLDDPKRVAAAGSGGNRQSAQSARPASSGSSPGKASARPSVIPPPVSDGRWKGTDRVSSGPASEADDQGGPLVPGSEWTGSAARARQKLLLLYGGSAVGLLLAIGVIAFLSTQLFSGSTSTAGTPGMTPDIQQASKNIATDLSPDIKEAVHIDSDSTDDPEESPGTDVAAGAADDSTLHANTRDEEPDVPTASDAGPEQETVALSSSPETKTMSTDEEIPGFLRPREVDKPELKPDDPIGIGDAAMEDLKRLSDFLEGSPFEEALQGELTDLNNGGAFTVDRAYIEKPRPTRPVNVARSMSNTIEGIKFENKSVADIVRLVEVLTRVPISFDPESIQQSGVRFNQSVTVNETGTTPMAMLTAIFEPHGLVVDEAEHGLHVRVHWDESFVARDYVIDKLVSDDRVDELMQIVRLVVDPKSWSAVDAAVEPAAVGDAIDAAPAGDARIAKDNGRLRVMQSARNHRKIAALLDQIKAVAGDAAARTDLSDSRQPRHTQTIDALKAESKVEFIQPELFGQLPVELARHHGMTVLVDWESLYEQGWNLQTEIPFGAPEATLFDGFDETLRAMNVSMVGYGPELMVITTVEAAGKQVLTEAYSLEGIVKNAESAKKLAQQVEKLIANELGANPNTAFFVSKAEQYYLVIKVSQERQIRIDTYLQNVRASLVGKEVASEVE